MHLRHEHKQDHDKKGNKYPRKSAVYAKFSFKSADQLPPTYNYDNNTIQNASIWDKIFD